MDLECAQSGCVQSRVARVEVGDDLEVRDQRAQLGGRAQVEPRPGIDVQRLVEVVGLDAGSDYPARARRG
jgi:hypothetical protein